jgi:hypothetical protein
LNPKHDAPTACARKLLGESGFRYLQGFLVFFARKTPAQIFWQWFENNEALLFDFERDQDAAFAALDAALAKVAPDLAFEFGPKDAGGQRELVISAGGIKAAFPAVEAIAAAAPRLARWTITAFRPRRAPMMAISFGDLTLRPEDVDCCILSNGRQLGLYLFFHGWTKEREKEFGQAGYLMLDEAIGEYDVTMKVGPIRFMAFDQHADADRFPLTELAAQFDLRHAALLQ